MSQIVAATWQERLEREWCQRFKVTPLRNGGFVIESPFVAPDGDALTLVISPDRGGWLLSDQGFTASQLQLESYALTDARIALVGRLADAYGASFDGPTLAIRLSDAATADDIANFVQLISQVRALPVLQSREDPQEEQFRTRARRHIKERLVHVDASQDNWTPDVDQQRLFPADLWIPNANGGVATFLAAGDEKLERSINSALQYREWRVASRPVILHQRGPSSRALARAQIALGAADVVEVDERTVTFAYVRAERRLRELGVELVSAA